MSSTVLHAVQAVRHIALKQWPEDFGMAVLVDTAAQRVLRQGDIRVYLFRAGVIGFYDAPPALQARVLAKVQADFEPLDTPHGEEVQIGLGERDGVGKDGITLRQLDDERLLLVALRLAQSVALELHEEAVENLMETTLNLLNQVEASGRLPGRRSNHLKFLASTSATRTEILARLAVLDNPDIVWDEPGLELLSRDLSADLELTSRFRALDEKLDAISEGLEVIIEGSRHNRETLLEWIIIVLIALEGLIMLIGPG